MILKDSVAVRDLRDLDEEDLITLATGGATRDILKKLERAEFALQVTTGAALFAGGMSLALLVAHYFGGRRQ